MLATVPVALPMLAPVAAEWSVLTCR